MAWRSCWPPAALAALAGAAYTQLQNPLAVSCIASMGAAVVVYEAVPRLSSLFLAAGISGADAHKRGRPVLPSSMGTVAGLVYAIVLFLFIPVPFLEAFQWQAPGGSAHVQRAFPHDRLAEFVAGVLSLVSMTFLGFADDVLNLRWRHKLLLPSIASLPLLMVYHARLGVTWVVMPTPLRPLVGRIVDFGALYYVYMGMLAVFCTNSINILAGINGVEVGQSLVIAASIVVNNVATVVLHSDAPALVEAHLLSLFFILPFCGVAAGLAFHNVWPARVFVGDALCYFAGMAFAVSGILGHFSKTLMLFFIPQIFNFVLSLPQLFRWVPCPRHRMPAYDERRDLVFASRVEVPLEETGVLGRASIALFSALGLVVVHEPSTAPSRRRKKSDAPRVVHVTNFTLLNLILELTGPIPESTLTMLVVLIQILCSALGFAIRYGASPYFYPR